MGVFQLVENMAGLLKITSRAFRISQTIASSSRNHFPLQSSSLVNSLKFNGAVVSNVYNPVALAVRHTSFFSKLPAEALWKGVLSVSNAGKKRGRGKGAGKKNALNLNRGQSIGVGVNNMLWPGLNAPVMRGKELLQQVKLPEDPERQAKLLKVRENLGGYRMMKLNPLERGWSGIKLPGRSLGPPDAVGEDKFEGFDTKVLEFKTVSNMSGNLGRTRSASAFVITGNKNGLAGFALAKANMGQTALRKARNRFLLSVTMNILFCTTSSHSLARQKFLSKRNLKDTAWCVTVLCEQYAMSSESRIFTQRLKAPRETFKI